MLVKLENPVERATARLLSEGLDYGSILTKMQLHEIASFLSRLKKMLLRKHRMLLVPMYDGGNYIVLHPREQVEWAQRELRKDMVKSMSDLHDRISNVELSVLDDAKRKEQSDALCRASKLGLMLKPFLYRRGEAAEL